VTAHVDLADRVRGAGSSFYGAMRLMPPAKRDAMYAIYAFARAVDDIADGELPPDAKRAALDRWRADIDVLYAGGRPGGAIAGALAGPIAAHGLERDDFLAVIAGVTMDAGAPVRAPGQAELDRYIDRVACAVGRLSVRVFGCPEAAGRALAAALGRALQLTNILRDLAEDAAQGRLYLPREVLLDHGIRADDPAVVLAHPAVPAIAGALAAEAGRAYDEARRIAQRCPRATVRPAMVMAAVYRAQLRRLIARGWRDLDRPVPVPRAVKLWLALRHGLL
jgi:phytoene synthase